MTTKKRATSGTSRTKRSSDPSSRPKALPRNGGCLHPAADAKAANDYELKLVQELQVHQVELEMQNEELRSARLEMELALRRYTELFDFAPMGYVSLQADQVIAAINHVGADLLGKPRSLLQGRPVEQLVSAEHQITIRNLLVSARVNPGRQICELELLRAGREPFAARMSATTLGLTDPQILLAFEDISERKERETKLERTERALREADRHKDEFLAALSHELRNPLAPIRQSVFVIAHSDPGSDVAHRAHAVIDRQVTHLTRLIDDLLDVTRIARAKIHLQLQSIELHGLLARTLEDHRGNFEARGVALDGQLGSALAWVNADSARLVQILSNLLTNSLKFTPRGGRVAVALRIEREHCVFEVSDTGVGVPPDVLEWIFEPFAQAPQTLDRAGGGLGLGLAMVKGLVELHGGTVRIESPGLGQGTRVTVKLPLGAAPPQADAKAARAPTVRPRRRVLVIEDNPDASDTLQVALSLNGHEVRIAHDGRSGIDVAAKFRPEIVICDIGLPGMDGYAVARALRRDPALEDVFLIALSGYAQPEDLQRARRAGFNRHLAKPASLEMLEGLMADHDIGASPARAVHAS